MYNDELKHFGVKGMKWGHRKKYYDSDGNLNRLGKARQEYKTAKKEYNKSFNTAYNRSASPIPYALTKKGRAKTNESWDKVQSDINKYNDAKKEYKSAKQEYKDNKPKMTDKQKTAIAVGAAAAGTALAAYGTYKFTDYIRRENTKIHVAKAEKSVLKYLESVDYMPHTDFKTTSRLSEKMFMEARARAYGNATAEPFSKAVKNVYNYRKKR